MTGLSFNAAEAVVRSRQGKEVLVAIYEKTSDDYDPLDCISASGSGVLNEVERDVEMDYRMYLRSTAWEVVVCDSRQARTSFADGVVFFGNGTHVCVTTATDE